MVYFFLVLYVTVLYMPISKGSIKEAKPVEDVYYEIYCKELAYAIVRLARHV